MYPPGAAYFYALDTANGDNTLSWFLLASYFFVVLAIMGVTYATVACLTRGRSYSYTELGTHTPIASVVSILLVI